MYTIKGMSIAVALGVLALGSCNKKAPKESISLAKGPHTEALPDLATSSAIVCDNFQAEMGVPPSKAYILHIPTNIMNSLAMKKFDCGARSCVNTATALKNIKPGTTGYADPNNDGVTGTPNAAEPIATFTGSSTNWRTPLDIDLNPDPKNSQTYWVTGQPILLQIVLDNPDFKFLRSQDGEDTDFSPYAVMQGKEGSGMFHCLGAPKQATNKTWSVTLRVFRSTDEESANNFWGGGSKWGGLNIGILVPTGVAGIYMPMFIDPQIHNSG